VSRRWAPITTHEPPAPAGALACPKTGAHESPPPAVPKSNSTPAGSREPLGAAGSRGSGELLGSPFPFYGGKQRIASSIIDRLPVHEVYIEPYFGGGSLLLAKRPAPVEVVNDLDGLLVTFWRVLRERPGELERVCRLTPHARRELELARVPLVADGSAEVELEIARRVWVQLTQGRGGAIGGNSGWRHYRSGFSMAHVLAGYADRLAPVAARLAEVSIECRDALEVIADYADLSGALFVCDPPYPLSTRSRGGHRYGTEVGTEHHQQLAETLNHISGKAVAFTYPNGLYDSLYAGWHRIELKATTGGGSSRTEVAYLNYEPPTDPSLLDFIGGDGQ